MSEDSIDTLIEIRELNKKIYEEKLKVQQSEQKLLSLENSINNVKQLQLKALAVLKETEEKSENTCKELEHIQKLYDEFIEHIHTSTTFISYPEIDYERNSVPELRKKRDDLKDVLIKAKAEKEEVAMKINNVNLQINIQKKKNAATILRLQKQFEELLQEEKDLQNKL